MVGPGPWVSLATPLVMPLKKKRNYHEAIHDGVIGMKETV